MTLSIKDTIELKEAGFTAEQIAALAPHIAGSVAPEPTPEPPKAPEPQEEPKAQEPPAPSLDDFRGALKDAVAEELKSIRQSNVAGSEQPPQPRVEDILAEVINPPKH